MATSALFQLNYSSLLPRLAARVIGKCKLLAHLPVAAHLSSSCRWILWQTSSYSNSSCHSRKMHLPFAVCINHTQNYDARLMANKSGANSRKHWRHSIVVVVVVVSAARSECRMRKGSHKSVEFGSTQLVLSSSRSASSSLFLCSASFGTFPVAICCPQSRQASPSASASASTWLAICLAVPLCDCLAVWQSDNLTVLAAWLLGFRATQAASLCAPVAACNLQLPVHTNLPLSNLLATAAAASSLAVAAVVVAPKCTLLFFKSQQADDNNTSWN